MSLPFISFLILIAIEFLGLAYMYPVLKSLKVPLIMALLLFVYVITKYRDELNLIFKSSQFKILTIFLIWACISILYALITIRVVNELRGQVGYFTLFIMAFFFLKDNNNMRRFIFFLLAIHFILVFLNIEKLSLGVRRGGLIAGYFLGDGNDFGWSLAIYFPFIFYLLHEYKSFILRCVTVLFGITALYGIILTGSRGASIAVIASILYVLIKLKKTAALTVLAVVVVLALAVAPSTYFERMDSIRHYEEDSSAKGRIMAWKAAIQMAIDYPLGVGPGNYASVYGRFYRDRVIEHSVYSPYRWISVHSIYFLTLAEYGIGGLILMLYLFYALFKQNRESEYIIRARDEILYRKLWLPISLKASLLSYCVAGIFLGGLAYPHIYLLAAMTLGTKKISQDGLKAEKNG